MNRKCIIISGAPCNDYDFIKSCVQDDEFVICADSGYITAQKSGIKPDLIVGDFDSSPMPETNIKCIKLPEEKDDTDTMFAVKYAVTNGYNNILLLASLGGRYDHSYANMCILKFLNENNASGAILERNNQMYYVSNGELQINNLQGCTLSIFPFGCDVCNVTLKGLKYTIKEKDITTSFPYAISNVVLEENANVYVHSGGAIIMVTRDE